MRVRYIFAAALAVMTAISLLTVNVNAAENSNTVYISTKAVSDDATEYAQDMFSEMPVSDLTYLGLSSTDAKSAVITEGFIAENLEETSGDWEVIYYPVVSDGKISAMMTVTYYNGKYSYQLGKDEMSDNLGSLDTTYDRPAKIYVSDNAFYAATTEKVVILSYGLSYNTKSIKQETAKVKTLYKERTAQGETVVAYGSSVNTYAKNDNTVNKDEWNDWYNSLSDDEKLYINYDPNGNPGRADDYSNFISSESVTDNYKLKKSDGKLYCIDSKGNFTVGWIEINGNKYYFKKDGSAVRKNTVVNGIRYIFNSDGICKGKYSGWVKKSGKYYYYKNGEMKKNCWLKVKGKNTYYLTSDGSRAVGSVEISGKTYTFDEDGELQ